MNCLQYLFGIRTTKKKASLLSETEYLNIYNVTVNNKGACLQGGHHNSGARLFIVLHGGRTQDNRYKLKHERFWLHIRKSLFMMKTVRHWNRLSQEVVQSLSSDIFKTKLGKPWIPWLDFNTDPVLSRGLDQDNLLRSLPTWIIVQAYNLWQKCSQFIFKELNKV